jgi:putative nucleotidyltransferase with HDIG domain
MDVNPVNPDDERLIRERVAPLLERLETHAGRLFARADALALLHEHVQSPSLRGHMLAVEAAMRAWAVRLGADPELYGLTGLLHDFDYEAHPEPREHPMVGCTLLLDRGYPAEMVEAILGHATYTGVPRRTPLARVLFAVDEVTGFLTAVAYVRPGGLEGLTYKSFHKKLKTPSFAAGVSRAEVEQGAAELGVDLRDQVDFLVDALKRAYPRFPETHDTAP